MIWRAVHRLIMEFRIKRSPLAFARSLGVQIGDGCLLYDIRPSTFGSEPYLIQIGNNVTITSRVQFVTHDGGVLLFRDRSPNMDVVAPIVIGNNVFVGLGSMILPGVVIGSNCVIGAGSVVTRNVASNTVVAGVPARTICSIEEYWEKLSSKAIYIRQMPAQEKRTVLLEKFGESLETRNH